MKTLPTIVTICLTLCATASNAASPIAGIWSAKPQWCAFKNEVGNHDPAPIKITERQIIGLENTCDIKRIERLAPKNAWAVSEECSGEGQSYQEEEIFMVDSVDKLHRFGNGLLVTLSRCK